MMSKAYYKSLAIVIMAIVLDQAVKYLILSGFRWESKALSIVLVFNDGVAFSMFAFLQGYLKWIQVVFLGVVAYFVYSKKEILVRYYVGLSLILGGGISNVIDRFVHGGVVDYVYWHYWFEFAIFNLADVLIDIGVGILILQWLWLDKRKNIAHKENI